MLVTVIRRSIKRMLLMNVILRLLFIPAGIMVLLAWIIGGLLLPLAWPLV